MWNPKEKLLNITKTIKFKDFCLKSLVKARPELEEMIVNLSSQLPQKKWLTIDYAEQVFEKGSFSSRDTSWHVDGENNHYLIICWGEFRTEFIKDKFYSRGSVKENNDFIKKTYKNRNSDFEIEEGELLIYDSNTIHRGRIANKSSKRIFLRLCMSDYLTPKNKIIKHLD